MGASYEFEAELFEWDNRRDKWVFAALPADISAEIADQPHPPAGWDSIKVIARIGATQWSTSIFPSSQTGTYSLAIKKSLRQKYGVDTGDTVTIGIEIV